MLDRIKQKLMQSGYDEKNAQSLSARLVDSEIIRKPLLKWLKTGEESDCSYEEISAFGLMRERKFTYPNALNTIAWLHKDPKTARMALASGIDRIAKGGQ